MSANPARRTARFWVTADDDSVECTLCPERCVVLPNRTGTCGVRTNRAGILFADTYGKVALLAEALAPALPLYHYAPAAKWLVVGQRGCTMRCAFCNTARYALQGGVQQSARTPEQVLEQALALGCNGISFGVNEPVAAMEYILDTLAAARAAGLRTHVATNGHVEEEPLRELLTTLDAITIGVKGFDRGWLKRTAGGDPAPVLRCLEIAVAMGVHAELTYVLIPGENDTEADAALLHAFALTARPTPPVVILPFEPAATWAQRDAATVEQADRFAEAVLARGDGAVYVDARDSRHTDTRCRKCARALVRRGHAGSVVSGLNGSVCAACGEKAPFAG